MKDSLVVYGPPGTGKSTFLVNQIKQYLDEGIEPKKIGVVSFTRAAAQELTRRTGHMVKLGHVGTLHSLAFRLAGCVGDQVVNRAKLREFAKLVRIETTGAETYDDDRRGVGDEYLNFYNYKRAILADSNLNVFHRVARVGQYHEFLYFVEAYEDWKIEHGYVDYADMLDLALSSDDPDFDVLIIDEAQDLSPQQWQLIEKWTGCVERMVLALDDDQTLFRFNGADPRGGPDFEHKHQSRRIVLDTSYRVPQVIHNLATRIIEQIEDRVVKEYAPARGGGEINRYGSWSMVPAPDSNDDVLILYRNHSLRGDIEEWLMNRGVPYLVANGREGPLQSRPAKAVRAWLNAQDSYTKTGVVILNDGEWRLLERQADIRFRAVIHSRDLYQIIQTPWHVVLDISPRMAQYLQRLWHRFNLVIPDTKIRLSTIHGAKGWEADRVILLDSMSGLTVEGFAKDPDAEVRCFYVGVTRTRDRLDVVIGDDPFGVLKGGHI